jgi:hypothetical protein
MASVQKRGNSWLLVVEAGIGPDEKRIKRTRTIKADGIGKPVRNSLNSKLKWRLGNILPQIR